MTEVTLSPDLGHELRCLTDFLSPMDQHASELIRSLRSPDPETEAEAEAWAQVPLREQEQVFHALHAELQSLGQTHDLHARTVQALAQNQRDLTGQLTHLDDTLAQLRDQLAFKAAKIQEMEAKLVREGTDWQTKGQDLAATCERYRKCLGLSVSLTDQNTIVFELSRLAPQDPERGFRCELATSHEEGQKAFTVLRCQPELETMSALEDMLNDTRDLSGFVVALRKKFKQTCH
ncbi:uncharacterized protein LOC131882658 [Tigriopus californicus]|nr:uncharacterized protein LOC131882658 [Tigriopus californicus]